MEPQTPVQPTANPPEPIQPTVVTPTTPEVSAVPPAPAAAPATPEPAYVGNTNIVDRSAPSLYPSPVASAPAPVPPADDQYAQASSAFKEIIVLIAGIASATAYILILYLVKNLWATAIVSVGLALLAIIISFLDYRNTKHMSPFSVVGLSAATITIVYVANILIAQAVINSAYDTLNSY